MIIILGGGNLDTLMAGKISLENAGIVTKWEIEGLAQEVRYRNQAFSEVENSNEKINFILQNLK